jgi:hypothetical protein
MALDVQLLRFMPHTVVIESYSIGLSPLLADAEVWVDAEHHSMINEYGEMSYNGSRVAPAYVTPNKTLDQNATVSEEHRPLTAYVADTNITLRDRITLPDGTAPEIRSIEIHVEVPGLEHTVVNFV